MYGAETQVTGITLSSEQVRRATELAREKKIDNANFVVMVRLSSFFHHLT